MEVFGWIVFLVATLYVSVVALGISVLCSTVSGRIGEGWIGIIVAAMMWWGTFAWAPFKVVAS